MDLVYKGFDQVWLAQWKKVIDHVQRVFDNKYWLEDSLEEECIDL